MTSAMKGEVAAFWGAVQKSKVRIRQNRIKKNKKMDRWKGGQKKSLVLGKQIWSSSSSSLERRRRGCFFSIRQ